MHLSEHGYNPWMHWRLEMNHGLSIRNSEALEPRVT